MPVSRAVLPSYYSRVSAALALIHLRRRSSTRLRGPHWTAVTPDSVAACCARQTCAPGLASAW